MRIACLRVADLPLAAERRAHPELDGRPLVIASGAGPRAELVSLAPEAARAGVRRGHSVAQARALCAGVVVRVASPALERAARDALLDAAFACTPRAELAPRCSGAFAVEAAVYADASGCRTLFASESGFASALAAHAGRIGLRAEVAVASSRSVARSAARQIAEPGGVLALPPERERAFLDALSIDLLDPDDALAETLTRFGVHCVRDLLALPRRGLAGRLGPDVLALIGRARGDTRETPLPEARDSCLSEAIDLEAPIERLDPLLFVLQGLLSRLLERLEARHLGCGDLRLELELDGGGRDARAIGVAAPTGDLRVLIRLARRALESRPPGAAVAALRIETRGLAPRRDQLDLFRAAAPPPALLDETVAALQGLCGDGRVGTPLPADSHHPDAYGLAPFAPPPAGEPRHPSFTGALALRALRPPVPAQVQLQRQNPARLRSAVANGRVLRCAGPWRSTGGWWSPERRFAFDHFDVQTEEGVVVRLRFDHLRRAWQIDALYD